jgi:hypothetical protein
MCIKITGQTAFLNALALSLIACPDIDEFKAAAIYLKAVSDIRSESLQPNNLTIEGIYDAVCRRIEHYRRIEAVWDDMIPSLRNAQDRTAEAEKSPS